jgi:26S proteasome regulatory subunit N12
MDHLTRARSLIQNFYQISDPKQKNDILKQLKLMSLSFRTLPPSNEPMNKDEYLVAREIIEIEMEKHLSANDTKNFELSYLKIKQFYFDYKDVLPKSERMQYYIGLYLLHLLASNRTTEFCTELELLDIADLNNNYIKVSRDLETCIMEGNYKHILSIKSQSTKLPYYNYYLEKFDDAIRFQIARSSEKSYDSLTQADAVSLLMMNNLQELTNFIKNENETRENREIDWKISNERVYFIPINRDKMSIPATRIIEDTITLASEIEKII